MDVLCGITAKEADASVRESLAEAVLCLARADVARKALWSVDAPTLLQKGYEEEENPTVCACMEATAELFLADGFQPPEAEGAEGETAATEEPQAAAAVEEEQQGGSGAQHVTSSGRVVHIEELD